MPKNEKLIEVLQSVLREQAVVNLRDQKHSQAISLQRKTAKRKRNLRKATLVSVSDMKRIRTLLPYL